MISVKPTRYSLDSISFFISFLGILFALIIDTSFVKIYRFTFNQHSLSPDTTIFYLTIGVYLLGLLVTLKFIRPQRLGLEQNLKSITRIIFPFQLTLTALVLAIAYQVSQISSYDLFLLKLVVWISYIQSISTIAFLVYKFITWLRSGRSRIILLYTLAISSILVNLAFTLFFVNELLSNYSSYIFPRGNTYVPYADPGNVLTYGYQMSAVISYLLMWIATTLLLYSYSKRLGKIRYWALVSMPLIYFIMQFQPYLLEFLLDFRLSAPIYFSILYTLFFVATKPVGGILFGVAFWSTGRKIAAIPVRNALFISGYGVALFFTSNQAVLLGFAPYPPFGLITTAFLGLAATLVLIGIYSVAISLAQDTRLRRNIRETLRDQSTLLDKIGMSQMEQQIQKRVVQLTQRLSDDMETESGIHSSLQEDDIKDYIKEVLYEIDKDKNSLTSTK